MKIEGKNTAASVHARLLNLAREQDIQFNLILSRFAIERLLFRLSRSTHSSRFVLKGAMLFALWSEGLHRSTRDLDLLGYGESSLAAIKKVFEELCLVEVDDDGLQFDPKSVEVEEIKSIDEYVGTRVKLLAFLGSAKVSTQVDVGIGDAVIPPATDITYPTLLAHEAPRLKAYRMETVIAEKFHAIVTHGMQNTRMKDYFDLYYLSQHFNFSYAEISNAIEATFARRGIQLPNELPLGLTNTFSEEALKKTQWSAFLRKMTKELSQKTLSEVTAAISQFIAPIVMKNTEMTEWKAGGPWR